MEQFNFGPAKVQVADELNSKVDKNQGSQHAGKVLGIGNDGAVTPVPFAGLDTKVDKNQGVQHAGKALGIGSDGMVTPVAFSGEDFTGATATTNGVHGYVPAPLAGEQAKVLTGDGTWQVSPGAKVYVKTITVTNTSGAYSQTFEDDNIVADMKAVELEVTRAYVFGDVITVTPANGSITVACSDVSGTDTIKISLIKVISDPTAITSTEFDILNNRLLAVENIYTDTSITIAASSWVLSSGEYVYTWVSQHVTTACGIEVFLLDGAENAGIESFEYEKVTGGVKFTSAVQPTGSLPVTIRIINAKASDIETITADMVATDIITGAVNVEEALEVLDEKPDYATEMSISSSDATTVSEALTSQSQAIANLTSSITPQKLTIVKASSNYTIVRGWAYKIGNLVTLNVVIKSSNQIGSTDYLFGFDGIAPVIDNNNASYNVPLVQINGGASATASLYGESGGRYYVRSASTVAANTEITIIGSFICQ